MRRSTITDAMREALAEVGDPLPDLEDLAARNQIPPEHRNALAGTMSAPWGPGAAGVQHAILNGADPKIAHLYATRDPDPTPPPVPVEKCQRGCGAVVRIDTDCDCKPVHGPPKPMDMETFVVHGFRYSDRRTHATWSTSVHQSTVLSYAKVRALVDKLLYDTTAAPSRSPRFVHGLQPHLIIVDDITSTTPMTDDEKARNAVWFEQALSRAEPGTVKVGGFRVHRKAVAGGVLLPDLGPPDYEAMQRKVDRARYTNPVKGHPG